MPWTRAGHGRQAAHSPDRRNGRFRRLSPAPIILLCVESDLLAKVAGPAKFLAPRPNRQAPPHERRRSPSVECVRRRDPAARLYLWLNRKPPAAFIEHQLGVNLEAQSRGRRYFAGGQRRGGRSLPETELGDRELFSWLCQLAERRIIDAHRWFGPRSETPAARSPGQPGGDTQHAAIVDQLVVSMTSPTAALSRIQKELHLLAALADCPPTSARPLSCVISRICPPRRSPPGWARPTGRPYADPVAGAIAELFGPENAPR